MPEQEQIRLELAFEGGQALAVLVPVAAADALAKALAAGEENAVELEGEDGHYLVVLRKVVYVKRYARESRVGFAGAS